MEFRGKTGGGRQKQGKKKQVEMFSYFGNPHRQFTLKNWNSVERTNSVISTITKKQRIVIQFLRLILNGLAYNDYTDLKFFICLHETFMNIKTRYGAIKSSL